MVFTVCAKLSKLHVMGHVNHRVRLDPLRLCGTALRHCFTPVSSLGLSSSAQRNQETGAHFSWSLHIFTCGQSWRVSHSCVPLVATTTIPTPFLNTHTHKLTQAISVHIHTYCTVCVCTKTTCMHWLQIPVGPLVYLLYKRNPSSPSCV